MAKPLTVEVRITGGAEPYRRTITIRGARRKNDPHGGAGGERGGDDVSIESYPLCWPDGYPRAKYPVRSRFGAGTLAQVRALLDHEIRLLGGSEIIISTNMPTRQDGGVYSNAKEPADSGVAVYFKRRGESVVLCCDRWRTVRENTRAIALSVAAMRGLDRWGVSEILSRIFKGFAALPAPATAEEWWRVLNVEPAATREEIKVRYRELIAEAHPDRGGSTELAAQINTAYEKAMEVVSP